MGIPALAMATQDATCDFKPIEFERRDLGPNDVHIEMAFCGICHPDLHCARGDLGGKYPCVPGHELAGVAVAVGSKVTKFQVLWLRSSRLSGSRPARSGSNASGSGTSTLRQPGLADKLARS